MRDFEARMGFKGIGVSDAMGDTMICPHCLIGGCVACTGQDRYAGN